MISRGDDVDSDVCDPVAVVDSVWFRYEEDYVLKNIAFEVLRKDIVVVMGPNGSGKSTLLKILAGILKPQRGKVYICGKNVNEMQSTDLTKYIGFVHQNPWFYIFNLKVYDEISFTLRNLGVNENIIAENVLEIATELDIVDLLDKSPFTLSEGEARRVVIASAVVHKPLLLLMDEPTAGLDYNNKKKFIGIIRRLNKVLGTAIVIATHDIDILAILGEAKIVVMNRGEIVYRGYVGDILSNPKILIENSLSIPVEIEIAKMLGINWRNLENFNNFVAEVGKIKGSLCR